MFQSLIDAMTDIFNPKTSYVEEQDKTPDPPNIGYVRGQDKAKRGLLISALGRHNILMIGPPGEGKTLLASTLPGFLPPLSQDEMKERSQYLPHRNATPLRPFIKTNSIATPSQLLGTGYSKPIPGLVTEAHGGILFLDEMAEFKKGTLDSLRLPLEDRYVFITRGGSTTCFPSNFTLVAATNPCPCGYYNFDEEPLEQSICHCTPTEILRYQRRISGPLLDRIDLVVEVIPSETEEQFLPPIPNETEIFRSKIKECINFRELSRGQYFPNNEIPGHEAFSPSSPLYRWNADGLAVLKKVMDQPRFSKRKATRLSKVSRTIADLLFSEAITQLHVNMAMSYVDNPLL